MKIMKCQPADMCKMQTPCAPVTTLHVAPKSQDTHTHTPGNRLTKDEPQIYMRECRAATGFQLPA